MSSSNARALVAGGIVELVHSARNGEYGPEARDLARVVQTVSNRGLAAADRADALEREANALASVVADLLNGAKADPLVDDLPREARRRVVAYRHETIRSVYGPVGGPPRDQYGKLPAVPPRAAVMRGRVRTIDAEP